MSDNDNTGQTDAQADIAHIEGNTINAVNHEIGTDSEFEVDAIISRVLKGKYLIDEHLADGGMGRIYKGQDIDLKRPIAVKMLHARLSGDTSLISRFRKEAEIASSLNHPNIVTVYDFGVGDDGRPFIVMDLIEGLSLKELILDKERLDLDETLSIFIQLANALIHTHERGIIHRDLKPSNILLHEVTERSGYRLKLLDFGIAKIKEQKKHEGETERTRAGTVFGSARYMSPEQVKGEKIDFRADIYSFGCLLFLALSGRPPYLADNAVDCMQMHVSSAIPDLLETVPDSGLPEALRDLIKRCLEKNPGKRFSDAGELKSALLQIRSTREKLESSSEKHILEADTNSKSSDNLKELAEQPPKALETNSPDSQPGSDTTTTGEKKNNESVGETSISHESQLAEISNALQNKETRRKALAFISTGAIIVILVSVPLFMDLKLPPRDPEASNVSETTINDGKKEAESKTSVAEPLDKKIILEQIESLLLKTRRELDEDKFDLAEQSAKTAYMKALSLGEENAKIAECLYLLGQSFEGRNNLKGALQAYNWAYTYRRERYGRFAPQSTEVKSRIDRLEILKEKESKANRQSNTISDTNASKEAN